MSGLTKLLASAGVAVFASLGLSGTGKADEDCGREYSVSSGDTLSKIAARCGTEVDALMRANPRITSPGEIAVGWRLTVPGGSDAAGSAPAGQPLALTGRIVNGRRCAMIETVDGESYGVVSRELAFVHGAFVEVVGQVVDDPSCTGPRTLRVEELSKAEPT